ncbi:MAG: hypothetical protein Ct9H90mP9_3000 [Pseudomonadota bacterium]|nr:MAG: hypothetical protein Ct9H90mP9_3000 [Pseudomonadota bacterium]
MGNPGIFHWKRGQEFLFGQHQGSHIAEAGANPFTQVPFYPGKRFHHHRILPGKRTFDRRFARNLSYFFSNGMDPEYPVIGRVAGVFLQSRCVIFIRHQKDPANLSTHSDFRRSLHAMEIDFNDIRTTLQALYAVYDNCNSLHTNAYDEAITLLQKNRYAGHWRFS